MSDDEDPRAELRGLRSDVERLEHQMEMVVSVFRMLDRDLREFLPSMRADLIDHLQALQLGARSRDRDGTALLRSMFDDVKEPPRD